MKLISFSKNKNIKIGVLEGDKVYDLHSIDPNIKNNMIDFIKGGKNQLSLAKNALNKNNSFLQKDEVEILSPVPNPPSVRDAYAFRQHVETARKNRGLDMIPEFDEIPIFYFTNHHAVFGEGDLKVQKLHSEKLDFELECAAVIGKHGKNISVEEADSYIYGFMIMNDLSARALQMQEMKMNLGPAKGKDFGSTFGPYLIEKSELEEYRKKSSKGDRYDLQMRAYVNDVKVSEDTLANMSWTFAQIIQRVSYGVEIFPGDIIGSGTCGTGCFLELNGSKITDNQWLSSGDTVSLEIEALGTLKNTIIVDNDI